MVSWNRLLRRFKVSFLEIFKSRKLHVKHFLVTDSRGKQSEIIHDAYTVTFYTMCKSGPI